MWGLSPGRITGTERVLTRQQPCGRVAQWLACPYHELTGLCGTEGPWFDSTLVLKLSQAIVCKAVSLQLEDKYGPGASSEASG